MIVPMLMVAGVVIAGVCIILWAFSVHPVVGSVVAVFALAAAAIAHRRIKK